MSSHLGVVRDHSKVGKTNDYNDLDNKPTLESSGLVEHISYDDIPQDEDGLFVIHTYESIKINLYRYLDDSQMYLSEIDVPDKDMLLSIIIKRTQLFGFSGFGPRKTKFPYFIDEVYTLKGSFLGVIKHDSLTTLFLNEDENLILKENPNCYLTNGEEYKSYIKLNLSDCEIEDFMVKIPFDFGVSVTITNSVVSLNKNLLGNCKIGVISSKDNKNLGIIDYSGTISKSNKTGLLEIVLSYVKEKIRHDETPNQLVGITNEVNKPNALNLENTTSVHSLAMTLTFKEAYGDFTETVINKDSTVMPDFLHDGNYDRALKDNLIDIAFSADGFRHNLHFKSTEDVIGVRPHYTNELERFDVTSSIDKFLENCIVVTSRDETDNDGTDITGSTYGFGVEFNEPTKKADLLALGLTDWLGSSEHQQSPASAIVAGKLKKIRDTTGASWGIIRQACRLTASNANNYNIYRGFGVIDVASAIAIIPNLNNQRSLELSDFYEATSRLPKELNFSDKGNNTEVVKRELLDFLDDIYQELQLRLKKDGNGSGLINVDADLLDGINSGQFMRADSSAIKSSGNLVFNNYVEARFGTNGDYRIGFDGNRVYQNLTTSNLEILGNSVTKFTFERLSGDFIALGNMKSKSFIKKDGTAKQYLMADGSTMLGAGIQELKISLTATQIKKLYTTHIQLLPSSGAGKVYEVIGVTFKYNYGTEIFNNAKQTMIGGFYTTEFQSGSTSGIFRFSPPFSGNNQENQPLTLSVINEGSGDSTTGDGTASFYVTYRLIEL